MFIKTFDIFLKTCSEKTVTFLYYNKDWADMKNKYVLLTTFFKSTKFLAWWPPNVYTVSQGLIMC